MGLKHHPFFLLLLFWIETNNLKADDNKPLRKRQHSLNYRGIITKCHPASRAPSPTAPPSAAVVELHLIEKKKKLASPPAIRKTYTHERLLFRFSKNWSNICDTFFSAEKQLQGG